MLINKLVCDRCDTINESDAKFCKECGSGNSQAVSKKIVEIGKTTDICECGLVMRLGEKKCHACIAKEFFDKPRAGTVTYA